MGVGSAEFSGICSSGSDFNWILYFFAATFIRKQPRSHTPNYSVGLVHPYNSEQRAIPLIYRKCGEHLVSLAVGIKDTADDGHHRCGCQQFDQVTLDCSSRRGIVWPAYY